ncbi:MAG: amino acid adenylation domain-containing protein, partial [Geminicoccaceae bacterium]
LLAAFQAFLFRYTHHRDIAVGSVIANRTSLETETLLGMLANTILLRTDVGDDPSFETLLERVRATTIDAYRHQDLPFDEVLACTTLPRPANGRAAVPVMFLLQSPASKPPKLGDADSSFVHVDPGWSRFDLTLELIEQEDGHLSGWFEYKMGLFEPATIERMAGHFLHLIDAALAEPSRQVSLAPLLDDAEHQELLRTAEGPKAPRSNDRSVIALFEDQAALSAETVAVIGGDVRLSFAELDRRANQLAHHLVDRGVAPGDFVGLMVGRGVDVVVALLGILKTGAAFVPLDPDYPQERLAFIIEDGGIKLIVSESMHVGSDVQRDLELVLLDEDGAAIACRPISVLPAASSQDDIAYVLYTSGSTGQPKGVLGTHRGLLHILGWVWRALPFEDGEVCCHKTSISFGDALQELLAPLLCGHAIVIIEKDTLIDLERFVDSLATHDIRRLVLVPSLLRALLREVPDLRERLPALALWISSGEALDAALVRQFHAHLPGRRLINIYGASEMSDIVTWHEVGKDDVIGGNPPIGRPIDNVCVYVLDGSGQLLPRGVPGELCVASPGLARGYHNRLKLEARMFVPHPFSRGEQGRLYRTGDRVRLRADGALDYLGRIDQQVQIRGCRVELGEVERTLKDHPAADQVAVLALADEQGDRQLIAFVQPRSGRDLAAESLHDFTRKTLPTYMLPSRYDIMDAFPLTPSGKIDRQRLKARDSMTGQRVSSAIPVRSPTEEILLGIWADVLKTDALGVTDHFFECGGHSLLAGQVLARVQSAFGVELPLRALFDHPTMADFASLVEVADPDDGAPSISALPSEPAALPSTSQEHVLQVERTLPGLPIFNLPYAFRLRGSLDIEAFRKAVHHVVQRHEALRTRCSDVDGRRALVVDDLPANVLKVDAIQCDIERAADIAKEEAWMPFTVSEEALLRIRLLQLAPDDHVCLITIHHVITDGWSMGILVRDLSQSYNAYRLDCAPSLAPDPPPAFSSLAAWQRRWCGSDVAARQRAFWLEKLAFEARARRADERPAKAGFSLSTAHQPIDLPSELRQRLIAFARRHGGTLYMTLLAALVPALAKLLGRPKMVVGTIVANRMRAETEHVFGPLENIVLLPLAVDGDRSLAERMPRVREAVLEATSNQDLPFDDLADVWPRETYG